jgi:hypothetical protein
LATGADSNDSERAQRQEKCLRILSIQNTNPVPVILVAPLPAGYVHEKSYEVARPLRGTRVFSAFSLNTTDIYGVMFSTDIQYV